MILLSVCGQIEDVIVGEAEKRSVLEGEGCGRSQADALLVHVGRKGAAVRHPRTPVRVDDRESRVLFRYPVPLTDHFGREHVGVAVEYHTWYYRTSPSQKIDFFGGTCYKDTMAVRIVFFDCDGTLTTVKSSWQYLHERLNLWDRNADEFQHLYRSGEIDYGEFCRRDAALWKGISEARVRGIMGDIAYHQGVRETMADLHRQGVRTVLLSTGLSFLVEKVKRELAIDLAISNELIVEEGVLTGGVRIHVAHDDVPAPGASACEESEGPRSATRNKGHWVRSILRDFGLKREEAAAVGDGDGDRGMFEEAGVAIGYYPSGKIIPLLDHVLDDGSFQEVFEVLRARV